MASFRIVAQLLSWFVTVAVARELKPDDYGLMSLASVLTGYVAVFSELGLGAALVQRAAVTEHEYSSNFWFSLLVGSVFSLVAFALAYPTAWMFSEPRVIPMTQLIAVLFLVGAVMTVPYSMLIRNLRFKAMGFIDVCAVTVASLSMLAMAKSGYGVWTLLWGTILLRVTSVVLTLILVRWVPTLRFKWADVRPFLRFGANVAGSRSLFYAFQKADVFVVGTVLGTEMLGRYSFALQLASMPTDKVIGLVNQMTFPLFSRLQDQPTVVRDVYLRTSKYVSLVLSPVFMAGAVWGDEILRVVLGDKWASISLLFRLLCVSQLVIAVASLNGAVMDAKGRSNWVLRFNLAAVLCMPAAMYTAAQYGFNALAWPWLLVYPALCLVWTLVTLRQLDVEPWAYARAVGVSAVISLIIAVCTHGLAARALSLGAPYGEHLTMLALEGTGFVLLMAAYLWWRERSILAQLWSLRRP